jgi:hypothetical protein
MPFVGPLGALLVGFIVAAACEILGNRRTRGFTRFGFGVVAARSFGLTLSGVVSFGADAWGLLPL